MAHCQSPRVLANTPSSGLVPPLPREEGQCHSSCKVVKTICNQEMWGGVLHKGVIFHTLATDHVWFPRVTKMGAARCLVRGNHPDTYAGDCVREAGAG